MLKSIEREILVSNSLYSLCRGLMEERIGKVLPMDVGQHIVGRTAYISRVLCSLWCFLLLLLVFSIVVIKFLYTGSGFHSTLVSKILRRAPLSLDSSII